MIEIDGSMGEGGGQVVRTSLALAALTRRPVRIVNIRKNRRNPGLGIQHLTALRAVSRICEGKITGDRIGSFEVTFHPGVTEGGAFRFDVSETRGSAGSASLIFQTLLLPLLFADSPSALSLIGGTHVPLSPPYHYLERVFIPLLRRMGARVHISLSRWGWYPIGKGSMEARVEPIGRIIPINIDRVGPIRTVHGISASSNLPEHVRQRQKREASRILSDRGFEADFEEIDAPSIGTGSFVFLHADPQETLAGFSALGARGKPAEAVAKEACDAFELFERASAPCDPFIADQIVPYLALAAGESLIRFSRLTLHLMTQVDLIPKFLPEAGLILEGREGEPGILRVSGVGWKKKGII
ncbi:MAG TPA: RNA 3'-terminal phosphate cyclase [Nitrospiria bacterium]|nr:RNA 3'-terminal phosphate cyclase [Nitrospiria bacterium]